MRLVPQRLEQREEERGEENASCEAWDGGLVVRLELLLASVGCVGSEHCRSARFDDGSALMECYAQKYLFCQKMVSIVWGRWGVFISSTQGCVGLGYGLGLAGNNAHQQQAKISNQT
jgi:hypothetical protein